MQLPEQVHGVAAWPTSFEKGDKALLKRKLLQPLGRPAAGALAGEGYLCDSGLAALPVPLRVEKPPAMPEASRLGPAPLFVPPCRPASASSVSSRPRTAERAARPLPAVSFPAQLRLRAPGEAPGPLGPFAGPGEALVIPLETQDAVKDLAASCSQSKSPIFDGACLTVWTLVDKQKEGSMIEPLAARRLDRTLAVEPIELVAERQGSAGASGDGKPLRFGEGFRLRAAGCSGLYLGHGADGGGLRWVHAAVAGREEGSAAAPPGTRFAAHGGELGASLVFGRPTSLRRVNSPPPSEDSDESEEEEESEPEDDGRRVRFEAPKSASTKQKAASTAPTSSAFALLPEAARYAEEGLFSRVADQADSTFPAAFLPLFIESEPMS